MLTSLPKVAHNLSEIYTRKYRDKNCKSECEFKELKNKTFSHNCKEFRKQIIKTNKCIN